MSSITGGSATSGYDNLAALVEFAKSPELVKKIGDLKAAEEASQKAADDAAAAISEADTKTKDLAVAQAHHAADAAQLASDRAAHDKRVALWNKAMDAVGKAMRGEE